MEFRSSHRYADHRNRDHRYVFNREDINIAINIVPVHRLRRTELADSEDRYRQHGCWHDRRHVELVEVLQGPRTGCSSVEGSGCSRILVRPAPLLEGAATSTTINHTLGGSIPSMPAAETLDPAVPTRGRGFRDHQPAVKCAAADRT